MAASSQLFNAEPYDYAEVRRLAAALELAEPIAVTLVRRGYRTVEAAREFLEARDEHDPFEFDGIEAVCLRAIDVAGEGGLITVHGDYDVDGVTSTAILVSTLRELGARCDWLIPDRMGGGYGLSDASVEAIRARGSDLVITVDCGVGSAEQVAALKAAGTDVVVTDHHEPPEALPDCPILHPVISGYPFSALCAAGVAYKLSLALRKVAGRPADPAADLDLVALATVADLVPLVGENRRLVRDGIAAARSAPRPGLRALMAVSRTDPETLDSAALGFRLAPRINAAGRLYRADAGVELMLTEDPDRAKAIAEELDRANTERRATERAVAGAAEAARTALPPEAREAKALVLDGDDWHPGVVGIAASRLAERHWRPTVLIGFDGDRGRGSARSVPGFDLIAALDACSEHLVRHGGHRAAAGLEIERSKLEAFRAAFLAHAEAKLTDAALARTESVDALVGVGREGIGIDLAEQLERLGPFGKGNPGPRLIVPSARLRSIRPLGEEGKHSRFEVESGAGRASGVAFGLNGALSDREDGPIDLSVSLEVDRWNGAVQPRVIVRDLYPLAQGEPRAEAGCGSQGCPGDDDGWWERLEAGRAAFDGAWPLASLEGIPEGGNGRSVVDRRRGAAVAAVAELVSSGESVLALCADAARRRELAAAAADPRRFGASEAAIACGRCGDDALDLAIGSVEHSGAAPPGLALADWGALARRPAAARRFDHVVLIDPPPFERLEEIVRAPRLRPGAEGSPFGAGFLHLAYGAAELALAELCASHEWHLRGAIAEIWRSLNEGGGSARGGELRALLSGEGRYPRTPEVAARCVAVLAELGLCAWRPGRGDSELRVLSSERTELERSRAYAAAISRHQEAITYLRSRARSG